jgi:hypothetical protein
MGSYVNIGSVRAKPLVGRQITSEDRSRYFGSRPIIVIEMSTNGQDADSLPGPFIEVGDPVTWTYVVTNTGNVTLTNVIIRDDRGTPSEPGDDDEICVIDILLPGKSNNKSEPCHDLGTAEEHQYANRATVTADPPEGLDPITDSDPSHYFGYVPAPKISVEKQINGQDADDPPGVFILVGDPAIWTYSVINSGNVPLDNVELRDDNGTPGDPDDDYICEIGHLSNQDFHICSRALTATIDLHGGTALVSGIYLEEGTVVSDTNTGYYFGSAPEIRIEKFTNGVDADFPEFGPIIELGGSITWTYVITNSGNITLTDILVVDDNGTPADLLDDFRCDIPILAAKEADWLSCRQFGLAENGDYRNKATVTGQPLVGEAEWDIDFSHYTGSSRLYLPVIIKS